MSSKDPAADARADGSAAVKPLVLVIEDDPAICRFLRVSLASSGYQVFECEKGAEGVIHAATRQPDLVILDLGLPDIDGLEVLRKIREWSKTPVIVLSARGKEADKVAALDSGADDYLTKPFGVGELIARMRVALRHASGAAEKGEPIFEVRHLRVDLARRVVEVRNAPVHLSPIEYRLLTLLIQNAGKVLTHRQILKEVWGPGASQETHYLRVYMGHLRHQIEEDPARPQILLTEPGVGYRLASD